METLNLLTKSISQFTSKDDICILMSIPLVFCPCNSLHSYSIERIGFPWVAMFVTFYTSISLTLECSRSITTMFKLMPLSHRVNKAETGTTWSERLRQGARKMDAVGSFDQRQIGLFWELMGEDGEKMGGQKWGKENG